MNEPEFIDGAVGKIAIHDLGGSGSETLLIAHATGFLGRVYRAFAKELTKDAHVIALDMRAHGDSDTPEDDNDMHWHGMADDLRRVVAHIGAESLHGFGHSMGGAALLEVERTTPGTFTSAMVYEPVVPPGPFGPEPSPIQRAAAGRMRTFPSRGHALERYGARPPLGLFRADVLSDYVRHGFAEGTNGEITLKCAPESEALTFANAGTIPLASLKDIDLDVVVAVSGEDSMLASLVDEIVEMLPNGRAQRFPTLSHFGPLQDPVVVANAVRELITAASS